MKIGVCALDSKLVNLAILKIASYHLSKGDEVKWYEPLFDQDLDKLYISKIFTFSDDLHYYPRCEVLKGGTGYELTTKLPDEIDNITDVSRAYEVLYPDCDYTIQFTTRGCVRSCEFCVVPEKEGTIHKVPTVSLNPKGKYIELLDNNFFSFKDWRERLEVIKGYNQPINFNTGIDVRTLSEEKAQALGTLKIKQIHCAFDNIEDEYLVLKGLKRLIKYVKSYKITCYVLVGFKQNYIIDSDHYRVMKLHEMGVNPFAMGYIDFNNPKHEKNKEVKDFCRWVNHKAVFKTVKWEEYKG